MHRRSTKPEKVCFFFLNLLLVAFVLFYFEVYLKIVFAWFQFSAKERDALGAFWDEVSFPSRRLLFLGNDDHVHSLWLFQLSVFDAKEILSLKNMMLEV